MRRYIHTHTCTYIFMRAYTYVHTCVYRTNVTLSLAAIVTHTYTCIHTHTLTYTCAHISTYLGVQDKGVILSLFAL